jgi:vacuolar protein sorting-associated protein 35
MAGLKIETLSALQKVLNVLKPAIEAGAGSEAAKGTFDDNDAIQCNVAKLVHLIRNESPAQHLEMLVALKTAFAKGGSGRLRYLLPAIVWGLYRLAHANRALEEPTGGQKSWVVHGSPGAPQPERLSPQLLLQTFEHAYNAIETIAGGRPEAGLLLLLHGVLTIETQKVNHGELEKLGFQFVEKAVTVFKDELASTEVKSRTISYLIGTLNRTSFFSAENLTALAKETSHCCTKLLRKQDQCRAILACTHMFCSGVRVRDGKDGVVGGRAGGSMPEEGEQHLWDMQDDKYKLCTIVCSASQ